MCSTKAFGTGCSYQVENHAVFSYGQPKDYYRILKLESLHIAQNVECPAEQVLAGRHERVHELKGSWIQSRAHKEWVCYPIILYHYTESKSRSKTQLVTILDIEIHNQRSMPYSTCPPLQLVNQENWFSNYASCKSRTLGSLWDKTMSIVVGFFHCCNSR